MLRISILVVFSKNMKSSEIIDCDGSLSKNYWKKLTMNIVEYINKKTCLNINKIIFCKKYENT